MALTRNGRANFHTPGSLTGVVSFQAATFVNGRLNNRNVGGFEQRFSAYPNGARPPGAFIMALKDGSISSYTDAAGEITPSVTLIPGRPIAATASLTITVTNAQLDQIASILATGSMTLAVATATLAGAATLEADGTMTLTLDDATLGAIVSSIASSSMTISGAASVLTALGFMEAEAGGPTELSPEGLANAVWDTVIADHLTAGTTGKALSDAGGAGNPWSALLASNNDPDTFGERVQKLLTVAKFLGLK